MLIPRIYQWLGDMDPYVNDGFAGVAVSCHEHGAHQVALNCVS